MKTTLYKTRVGELFVAEAGEGAPLIAVHGALTSGRSFAPLLDKPPEGFHVIAVDLPGHGRSPSPERPTAGWAAASDVIVALIESLELSEVHLLGHSMGGGICAYTAAEHPATVRRLLLLDSATAPFPLPIKGRIPQIPGIGEFVFKFVYGKSTFFRYFRDDIFFDAGKIDEKRLTDYYEGFDRNRDTALKAVRMSTHPGPVYERLPRITCPTLVAWGRNDPLIPLSVSQETVARIPGAISTVIDDCGHSPFEEQPIETLGRITAFLRS